MINTAFGEMNFSVGWKTDRRLKLFGKEYPVTVKVQAYYETDELPSQQLNACDLFVEQEDHMVKVIEHLMKEDAAAVGTRFTPRTLLFKQEGSIALLCDDEENPDEGIAVCLYPEMKVMSQDDYL